MTQQNLDNPFFDRLGVSGPMIFIPHEAGFLLVPEREFPAFVRKVLNVERRKKWNLGPIDDVHLKFITDHLGTGERLRMFVLATLESLAMASGGRVSDALKDAMGEEGQQKDPGHSHPPAERPTEQRDPFAERARQKRKEYDPDDLWRAIEDVCKGGG